MRRCHLYASAFPGLGLQVHAYPAYFFVRVPGSKHRSSCLHSEYLINWAAPIFSALELPLVAAIFSFFSSFMQMKPHTMCLFFLWLLCCIPLGIMPLRVGLIFLSFYYRKFQSYPNVETRVQCTTLDPWAKVNNYFYWGAFTAFFVHGASSALRMSPDKVQVFGMFGDEQIHSVNLRDLYSTCPDSIFLPNLSLKYLLTFYGCASLCLEV